MPQPRTAALRTALEVFVALAAEEAKTPGGLGVMDIARVTAQEKSQVSRILQAFVAFDLVERDEVTRKFRVGSRLYVIAQQVDRAHVFAAALPVLRALAAEVGESAHLSVALGQKVLTVSSEYPLHNLQTVARPGDTFPIHSSSPGRALLLDHDRGAFDRTLAGAEFDAPSRNAVKDVDDAWQRLCRDRERGFVVSDEETEDGLTGVAVPVRNFENRIVAAINVSGPRFRLMPKIDQAAGLLIEYATVASSPRCP